MPYKLEGSILEVCDCNVLCPCCIGQDLDLVGHNVIQGAFGFEG